MLTLIITLIILVAILLVLVVLAQNSKGGGLSSQFGGSGASQVVGVKRTGDILEKTTWVLAVLLVVLSLSSSIVIKNSNVDRGPQSPNMEKVQDESLLPDVEGSLGLPEGETETEGEQPVVEPQAGESETTEMNELLQEEEE